MKVFLSLGLWLGAGSSSETTKVTFSAKLDINRLCGNTLSISSTDDLERSRTFELVLVDVEIREELQSLLFSTS